MKIEFMNGCSYDYKFDIKGKIGSQGIYTLLKSLGYNVIMNVNKNTYTLHTYIYKYINGRNMNNSRLGGRRISRCIPVSGERSKNSRKSKDRKRHRSRSRVAGTAVYKRQKEHQKPSIFDQKKNNFH